MHDPKGTLPKIVHAGGHSGKCDFPVHTHENAWELVYLREGNITEITGDEELDMTSGMFVVHPPSAIHGDRAKSDYFLYHVLVASSQPLAWPKFGQDLEGAPIGLLLQMIVQEWYGGSIYRESFLKHCSGLLDILMKRSAAQSEEAGAALRVVSRARGIFRRDFRHPLKMSEIAAQLGVSRSTLYAHFHEVLAKTPQDVLDEIRLKHAIYLLKHSQLSVEEVAKGSGHYSSSHLSRKLRRAHDLSAKQIRKLRTK